MKSFGLTVNNIAPFFIAAVVSASTAFLGFGFYHGTFHVNANQTHCHQDGVCHNHWGKFVIIAILSSVVSIVTWESLHVVYHIDEPKQEIVSKK